MEYAPHDCQRKEDRACGLGKPRRFLIAEARFQSRIQRVPQPDTVRSPKAQSLHPMQ